MFSSIQNRSARQTLALPLALAASLLMVSGCGDLLGPQPTEEESDSTTTVIRSALTPMCTVNVQGKGSVSVEDDYIPRVITCENGNASFEALKAQAIAARTYAKFKMETSGSLVDGQGDQVYSCGREPSQEAIRAARETAGQVLTHNGTVLAAFYVSGVRPSSNTCVPSASDANRASSTDRRVERYVTYNRGKTGNNVRPSSLGHPGNPRNRGCMSQNGSDCLSDNGMGHQSILRFYYGDDVRLTQLGGSCGGSTPGPDSGPTNPGGDGSGTNGGTDGTDPGGQNPGVSNNTDGSSCVNSDFLSTILPRSSWGAAPATANRQPHTPDRILFHHTVQPQSASGPDAVRQIQNWHQRANGMADIAYHFIIDRDGTIYSGTPVDRIGAHMRGNNIGSIGIAMIADFTKEQPQLAQLQAAMQLALGLAKQFGFELDASTLLGGYLGGAADIINQILGGATECSGGGDTTSTITYQYIRYTNTGSDEVALDAMAHVPAGQEDNDDKYTYALFVEDAQNVENGEGARGAPNATSCADYEANTALFQPGGKLTMKFAVAFLSGSTIKSFTKSENAVLTDCEKKGTFLVEISRDGQNWVQL